MLGKDVPIEKVSEFSKHAEYVPSDHSDWAGMTSSTKLEVQNELLFEEFGIAFVDETYSHSFQVKTSISIRALVKMQDSVGCFEKDEKNEEGVVEKTEDARNKYTLEGRIRSLLLTIFSDGRKNGNPTVDNTTVEYKKHPSLSSYQVLVKWS